MAFVLDSQGYDRQDTSPRIVNGSFTLEAVLVALRLALASIFLLAGTSKLMDIAGSRTALQTFGIPKRLARTAGTVLPVAEIMIGFALLPIATAWWGALAALCLLLAFLTGISYNLMQGRQPDCFGQLHSAPIGQSTLVRNGILAALAAVLVAQSSGDMGYSLAAWRANLSTPETIGVVLLALMAMILLAAILLAIQLLQQHGRILIRLDTIEARIGADRPIPRPANQRRASTSMGGMPIGTPAPEFTIDGVDRNSVSLTSLQSARRPIVLIFTDPDCASCTLLLPEIATWQRMHAHALTLALVSCGTIEANTVKAREHQLQHLGVQQDREVFEAFQSFMTPGAVLIRIDGTIGSEIVLGPDAVRNLVSRSASTVNPSNAPKNGNINATHTMAGSLAPALSLPNLDGASVDIASPDGVNTLVIFWNPACGFCARMLNDLKSWEAAPQGGAPRLIVVSTGSVDANTALRLKSTVVLDQHFVAGRAFGASGTPSAVLIDGQGRIASGVVTGASAVLDLAYGSSDLFETMRQS